MLPALVLMTAFLQAGAPEQTTLASQVVQAIDRNYLYAGSPNWQRLRRQLLTANHTDVSALNRKLSVLHDGDLRIVTSSQAKAIQAEGSGDEHGIGLVDFALALEPGASEPRVVTPLIGSPAWLAGLLPGDEIVAVNGQKTRDLVHEDVMALLRGDAGSLNLKIRRKGRLLSLQIPLKVWKEDAVVSRRVVAGQSRLAYVAIHLFTPESGDATRQAIAAFAADGVEGCIVDLRNNPGGYLGAMAIAGSAFTDQTLGWKVRRDHTREPIQSDGKPLMKARLVVIVNEGTASAAEVLAAGLRDAAGAQIVGAKTYGRGQIQTYVQLSDNAGIAIPSANVESARGTHFNKRSGLSPDIAARAEDDNAYREAIALLERPAPSAPLL
jgi:carboxyl-terminal processing protease